jgi:hypothetical protein
MSYAFKYLDCKFEEPDEDYFGYIYYTWDQKRNMPYIGQKWGRVADSMDYFGSGTIIKAVIKKRGTYFLKKTVLGVCYSEQELTEWETYCKEFFDVYCPNGYNIARKDTGGDTISRNPRREEIIQKAKEQRKTDEYKNTSLKQQIEGYKKTTGNEEWKNTIGKEKGKKISNSKNDPIWKETVGKAAYKKISDKKNDSEWIEATGKSAAQKTSKKLKERYKSGDLEPWCKNLTKETHPSLQIIGEKSSQNWKNKTNEEKKERGRKISQTKSDPIWKETVGKPATEKIRKTLIENGSLIGEKNPMYGSTYIWYTNGKENRRGTSENIEQLTQQGFWIGRINKNPEQASNNYRKAQLKIAKRGGDSCHAKKVKNIDMNKIFSCVGDAAKFYDIPRHYIDSCCKKQIEVCKLGFHWEYYHD